MTGTLKSLLLQNSTVTRCSSSFTDHHVMATTEDDDGKRNTTEIPSEFICPITQSIMKIPLKSRYGHTYECDAILSWLGNHSNLCPLTRKELNVTDLIRDRALQERIEGWQRSHHPEMVNSGWKLNDNDDNDIFPLMLITCRKSDFETDRSNNNNNNNINNNNNNNNNNTEVNETLLSETMMQHLSSVIEILDAIDDDSQRDSGSERSHHRRPISRKIRVVPRILRLIGSSK